MKVCFGIAAVLATLSFGAIQARAVDVQVGRGPQAPAVTNGGVNVEAPGVGVHVNGAAGVVPAVPNAGIVAPAVPNAGIAPNAAITDNRPDAWRYKQEGNRWWYWTPENRWMWYTDPGGWTYYQPSGSYATGYGGVAVAPDTTYVAPTTTYYPNTYYYGYPYYYGRPGVYIGVGGWGYRGGRGGWRR